MSMGNESSLLRFTVLLVLLGAILYGVWFYQISQEEHASSGNNRQADVAPVDSGEPTAIDLLFSERHADMDPVIDPPEITGDEDADERIRDIAMQRGYVLWPLYSGELEELEGVSVPPELIKDWMDLAKEAEELDVELVLETGFVSYEEARDEFVGRLQEEAQEKIGREYSVEQISGGTADATINAILREYPAPGFTPHHSGYVLEVNSGTEKFLATHADAYNFTLSEIEGEVESTILVWMGAQNDDQ